MRLWKLSQLADEAAKAGFHNRLIVHICIKCARRTPIPPKLMTINKSPDLNDAIPLEVKDNYCDKCNVEVWRKIRDYQENNG